MTGQSHKASMPFMFIISLTIKRLRIREGDWKCFRLLVQFLQA